MSDFRDDIIDEYTWHYRIESESYRMMGKMLDEGFIRERLKIYGISELYIYGGTYLAAQLYHSVKNSVRVKAIVDKGGRSALRMEIPVITLEEMRKIYAGEKVIITPPRYYKEAKNELSKFIELANILFLGEFLEALF